MKHTFTYLRRSGLVQSLILMLVSAWLSGCSPNPPISEPKTFSSLVTGFTLTAEISNPTLFVFNNVKQARQVTDWLEPDSATTLLKADFYNSVVVLAFWGPKPSTGYVIAIQDLAITGTEIRLIAKLTSPVPDSPQSMVVSYPYHAITIPRDAIPKLSGTTWFVYDTEGSLITKTTIP